MHEVNLRNLDLNLLVILNELIRLKNITYTAKELGMSQPAVSRSLQKLRKLFGDELLIRVNKEYQLSNRAVLIESELDQLISNIKNIIQEPIFDPKKSHKTICIHAQDPEIIALLPTIYNKLQSKAPNMKLKVFEQSPSHFELLEKGEVHFKISAIEPINAPTQLYQTKLCSTGFVSVMRKKHQLSIGKFTLKKYLSANHAIIAITGKGETEVDKQLAKKGKRRNVSLTLSSFSSIAHICEHSNTISLMPTIIAKEVTRGKDLIMISPPKELDIDDINFYLYWHSRSNSDPMYSWIKKLIVDSLQKF